ncbi:MAG TPA: transaldolase [Thermoanaerobaculia bacterium]|nr:transaldolase [Thermoanaerobaculia bacterium]HQR67796.1 transaldolase [Thermoanaerobaculia bacterium]
MSVPVEYRHRGQAVWMDSISDRMITSGRLAAWIGAGTVYGVTSNPTIFGLAVERNEGDYSAAIARRAAAGADAFTIYDELTRHDIARGADLFAAQHAANPEDGWISLEVLPSMAHSEEETVAEATRLSKLLGRPNVFIKVPATREGIPAIRRLIGRGIPVNVTLMFNRRHYRDVAGAYLAGLADLAAGGGDLRTVASVASFFVSRVDTLVDRLLDERIAKASGAERGALESMKGKAALANAKVVYQDYREIFGGAAFRALAAKGARVQRPLWASTGTKNPAYGDLLYVENLVGPDTVNTVPEKTLEALLDHGRDRGDTVLEGVEEARRTLEALGALGLDVEAVGERLQTEGVASFATSYDDLLATVEARRAAAAGVRA